MKAFSALAILLLSAVVALTPLSIVDHEDPYYWDICLEKTGELCEFCCLTA